MAGGEVNAAEVVMRPWQRAHSRTSSKKTREMSDAQGYRRGNGAGGGASRRGWARRGIAVSPAVPAG